MFCLLSFAMRKNKRFTHVVQTKTNGRKVFFQLSLYIARHRMARATVEIPVFVFRRSIFNTLRPRQYGRHFADDTFKRIFLNENVRISLRISLKFVPNVRINNIPSLVQIMAWRRPGDKPLSEPMVVNLLTHICVTRPQWVKRVSNNTSQIVVASTFPCQFTQAQFGCSPKLFMFW